MRFKYVFSLAPPSEPVSRRVTTIVDGLETTEDVENDRFELIANRGDSISVSFVDVDAAGNESEPAVVFENYVVVDTVPPSIPSVTVQVEQLPDENPTPDDPGPEPEAAA